ncbi:MAG TPA: M20/M25/M40 family metallo-hydrolase [Steroidobacteraceae bacterium]|nr:M20/M25/M40 family metallo-hydrolase [Steroidobacteraceae bacterium]
MRLYQACTILASVTLGAGPVIAAPKAAEVRDSVRSYREQHEPAIVTEFARLLAMPNLAADSVNIRKNAEHIASLLRERQVETRLLELEGAPPIVFGKIDVPGATQTVTFYVHYDGQPTKQSGWKVGPFEPTLRRPDGSTIDLKALPKRLDPEWRLFARSASDDKAPVIGIITALDALRAAGWRPNINVRFFFEGEEEAGSPHLGALLKKYEADLKTDLWIVCDGPVHQNGRKLVDFGVRGTTSVELTVYGPNRGLHSGHYGNWAPNPIVMLTHLLDSMRDTQARILIPGFYDDVRAPTETELTAARAMPDYDAQIKRELGLARTENEPASLQAQLLLPALNVRGIAGGNVGDAASNTIVSEAMASIDFRLVPDQTPESVRRRVEQHVEKQGYFIVRQPPDQTTRLAHAQIAMLAWDNEGSYPAQRTSMDNPLGKQVVRVVEQMAGAPIVVAPTLGGSAPEYLLQGPSNTPVVGVPIANYDNNQHAANENIRLQNLWDAIEIFAGLLVLQGS